MDEQDTPTGSKKQARKVEPKPLTVEAVRKRLTSRAPYNYGEARKHIEYLLELLDMGQ